ncbi:hypothetical protein TNCT_138101, partial [Trichonephila clavata]
NTQVMVRDMKDPCQIYACDLQKCRKANNYKEEACVASMKSLLDCCEKWKSKSKCCEGFVKT